MIALESLEGTKLSRGIRNLSPIQYDGIQIKNKLLDGSYHIQNIGVPSEFITFEVLANHGQVDSINLAESKGENLKLVVDEKYYIGLLERPEWDRLTKRHENILDTYYTSRLKLIISEEGVI